MEWELEVDGKRSVIADVSQLQSLLLAPETRSARNLTLERLRRKKVPGWEKFVYRILGLRSPESEAHGTLEVSLSSDQAFVVFMKSEDDDGAVGTSGHTGPGRVDFVTTAGEAFSEVSSRCILRDEALAVMTDFMRSATRPSGLKWLPVGRSAR